MLCETDTQDDFYTPAQVAAMYGVPERVVCVWCEVGRIQASRDETSGVWRIMRSEFTVGAEAIERFPATVERIDRRFDEKEIDDYERSVRRKAADVGW